MPSFPSPASSRPQSGDPGAIVQLNMGEGKTRVILPMLALHLAQRGGGRIVSYA
jgi:hypothetical protein